MNDKVNKLKAELQHFCGTETYFLIPTAKSRFTDGLKYLAETAKCYWMITDTSIVANTLMDKSHFITIDFKRLSDENQKKEGCEAVIIYSDGNDNVLEKQKYRSTNFPLDELRLFFVDNTLMLPSEY